MAQAILVLDGGERVRVTAEYEDVRDWFSHTASRSEVRQFEAAKDSGHTGLIAVNCAHIRAVYEGR